LFSVGFSVVSAALWNADTISALQMARLWNEDIGDPYLTLLKELQLQINGGLYDDITPMKVRFFYCRECCVLQSHVWFPEHEYAEAAHVRIEASQSLVDSHCLT
jgi:hypothetical protein